MVDPIIDGGTPTGLPTPTGSENTTTKIVLLVKHQLQDLLATGVLSSIEKWRTNTTVLRYLNLGIIEIINLQPSAYPVTKNLTLVAGPIQALEAGDNALLDAVCNMGSGLTIGRSITSIIKENMDRFYPGWMTATAADEVLFVITDPRTPTIFYIYPPQTATPKKIRVVVSRIPTEITALDGTFPLGDDYKPAMVDYIVHRCLMEETTVPNALAKGKDFYNKFLSDLGLPAQVQKNIEEKGK